MPAPDPRNLIIGAIEGYRFETISQFFTTLRRAGYDGDLILFHRNIDEDTLAKIREHGGSTIALPPRGIRNPFTGRRHSGGGALGRLLQVLNAVLRRLPFARSLHSALSVRFYHIANGRFLVAEEFLRRNLAKYRHVLITDVRDVIFQSDPFAGGYAGGLCTFLEYPGSTMRGDISYKGWMEAEYGPAQTAGWLDERLASCGLTMGPAPKVLDYLAAVKHLLLASKTQEPYRFGLDSAVHNYIRFTNMLPGFKAHESFAGPVATLGTITPAEVLAHFSAGLRNNDGTLVNIIHQFDRHECCRRLV